jgi:hypothetical protein
VAMRSIVSRMAAVAATIVAAGLVLVSPASAQVGIEVLDVGDGSLVAKGASVTVPVTFVCEAGDPFTVQVGLTQRVSGKLATEGSGQVSGTCNGAPQTASVPVQPETRNGSLVPFKKGTTFASVELSSCPEGLCTVARASEEIRIR